MLAGHNRGKKWVPSVGYRTPDRPPPPPPKCERCGEPATAWATWHGWRCDKHRTKHPGYRANNSLTVGGTPYRAGIGSALDSEGEA